MTTKNESEQAVVEDFEVLDIWRPTTYGAERVVFRRSLMSDGSIMDGPSVQIGARVDAEGGAK